MPKRFKERYDVEIIRLGRGELRQWPNTGKTPLSDIIDSVVPHGTVFHILSDVPDDSGLELTVLVDGLAIVWLELPWLRQGLFAKQKYLAGSPPLDSKVWALDDYRHSIGQGKRRIMLDQAVADAQRLLA